MGMVGAYAPIIDRIEELARARGLSFEPVYFRLTDSDELAEVASMGLPNRFIHWYWGGAYKELTTQQNKEVFSILELVLNPRPPEMDPPLRTVTQPPPPLPHRLQPLQGDQGRPRIRRRPGGAHVLRGRDAHPGGAQRGDDPPAGHLRLRPQGEEEVLRRAARAGHAHRAEAVQGPAPRGGGVGGKPPRPDPRAQGRGAETGAEAHLPLPQSRALVVAPPRAPARRR